MKRHRPHPKHVALRREYLALFPNCQYMLALEGVAEVSPAGPKCVEHIFNRHGSKSEHFSNYATVGPAAHRWKHANSVEARISILFYKRELARQLQDERLFDLEAIRAASGYWLPGWVEKVFHDGLPEPVQEMARLLMEAM